MSEERNRLKKELEKRGITVNDLQMFEAYGLATIIKEDLTIEAIADYVYYGTLRYFNWDDDDFVNKIERIYIENGKEEWLYTTYLDDLEKIVKGGKGVSSYNYEGLPIIDAHKLHLNNDKEVTK